VVFGHGASAGVDALQGKAKGARCCGTFVKLLLQRTLNFLTRAIDKNYSLYRSDRLLNFRHFPGFDQH